MHTAPDPGSLAAVMPGSWGIRASNLVHWLSGERIKPTVSFELSSEQPLVLIEEVRFTTPDNKDRVIKTTAKWTPAGFVVRGRGLKRLSVSRWSVGGISADGTVVVARHRIAGSAGDGIDVLVKEPASLDEVRAMVAHESETFGLSLEDFAKLNWLVPARP